MMILWTSRLRCLLYLVLSSLFLAIFHLLLSGAQLLQNDALHYRIIDMLNRSLLALPSLLGWSVQLPDFQPFPDGRPILVLANHQHALDVSGLGWIFRSMRLRYVAKIELGQGIPSVSRHLRKGGSALIDRDNPRQAMKALTQLGRQLSQEGGAVAIFPEGTRARTGQMAAFHDGGVGVLLRQVPDALIIPVAIQGTWQAGTPSAKKPERICFQVLSSFSASGMQAAEVVQRAEHMIAKQLLAAD